MCMCILLVYIPVIGEVVLNTPPSLEWVWLGIGRDGETRRVR